MASSNDLITNVGQNSNDTAALIWSVADDLVGAYKPHEYGLVILPMTVIKRFHDCLLQEMEKYLKKFRPVRIFTAIGATMQRRFTSSMRDHWNN